MELDHVQRMWHGSAGHGGQRQTSFHPHTPAIALSGYGSAQPKGNSQQARFTGRLTKPVQYDELVDTIEAVCKHAGT